MCKYNFKNTKSSSKKFSILTEPEINNLESHMKKNFLKLLKWFNERFFYIILQCQNFERACVIYYFNKYWCLSSHGSLGGTAYYITWVISCIFIIMDRREVLNWRNELLQ